MKNAPRILIILLLASLFLDGIFPAQAAPNLVGTPVLIAYDSFTRADGSIGSTETTGPASESLSAYAWTGGAISGNKNVISPSLGSELVVNGNMELDSNWDNYATPVSNERSAEQVHTSTYSRKVVGDSNGTGITQSLSGLTNGSWYALDAWQYISSKTALGARMTINNPSTSFAVNSAVGSWVNIVGTYRSTSTTSIIRSIQQNSGTITWYTDDVSLRPLTTSSLFSTLSTGKSDAIASANVTVITGTQGGVITNLDSTTNPQNFIIAYVDGTNTVKVDKCVNGVYTNLANNALSYVSGASVRIETDHTDANTLNVKVYYNNAIVGGELTITNASIINNTIHGLFSTYSGNTFDNFYLYDNNPATATATSTATFTATATSTATATQTETPTATATGTLEPTYTPTITETPTYTPEPTATATLVPVIFPTLNAEEFTLSSGHTFYVERSATFGEVGVMLSLLCISMPFGALAFLNYLNKKR